MSPKPQSLIPFRTHPETRMAPDQVPEKDGAWTVVASFADELEALRYWEKMRDRVRFCVISQGGKPR